MNLICTTCSLPYRDCECTDTVNVWTEAGVVFARFAAESDGEIISITHELTPERARALATTINDMATHAEASPEKPS